MSLFERYSPRARRVVFYSLHYARQAGAGHIEPEHILEGLLFEDPQLFTLVLPEKPTVVKDLKDELATLRDKAVPQTEKKELPLSRTAKAVVAGAGTHQHRLGHTSVATQHILLALLTACRRNPGWFRKATELPVQQLLSKHGVTHALTENRTNSGIVTPTTWVLVDPMVSLNAQIAALADLLIAKRLFTRTEFVSLLDQNEGPLAPEAFLFPLIEALGKNGVLTANEQQHLRTVAGESQQPVNKTLSEAGENPTP